MHTYILRDPEDIYKDLREIGQRRAEIDWEYRATIADIDADIKAIKAELALLQSMGKIKEAK